MKLKHLFEKRQWFISCLSERSGGKITCFGNFFELLVAVFKYAIH